MRAGPPPTPHASCPVVLLTGTPGSGKSSVARALAQRFPFGIHIPVDDLREWVVSGIAHPVPVWTDETSRQFALARRAAASVARIYAEAGFIVAIDDVIFPAEAATFYEQPLAGCAVHKVLLRPRLECALGRNAARTSKAFDTAVLVPTIRDLYRAMDPGEFASAGWLVRDTSDEGLDETVDAILARLGR